MITNQPETRFRLGDHSPILPNLCVLCHQVELPRDKSVCTSCFVARAGATPEQLLKSQRQEENELKRLPQFWQASSGYNSKTDVADALDMTPRGVEKAIKRLDIEPEEKQGHRVVTDNQLKQIKKESRYYHRQYSCFKLDDGTIKITVKLGTTLLEDNYSPQGLRKLVREGIVSGFYREVKVFGGFITEQCLFDVVALEQYLASRQRLEDAQRLRTNKSQLLKGHGAPVAPERLSNLRPVPPVDRQTSVSGCGDES